MSPLEQAREAGYSDEEIVAHISTKEPDWAQKYQKAKSAGYSDAEILAERQKRLSKELDTSSDEIELENEVSKSSQKKPLSQMVKEVTAGFISPKPNEAQLKVQREHPFAGVKAGTSSLTLGLSENIPGMSLSKEERENLSTSDKAFDFLAQFVPVELGIKLIANPITKKTAQWAAKSPIGKQALESLGRLTGIAATGAVIEGTEQAFKGELPSIEDMASQGALWGALDIALSTIGATGRFTKALIKKSKSTNKPSGTVLRDTINKMQQMGVDFTDTEKTAAIGLDLIEGRGKDVNKITVQDLKSRNISKEATKALLDDSSKLSQELPKNVNVDAILDSMDKDVSEVALDNFSRRAETELELGNSVKNGIDAEILAAKNIYNPLYDFAQEVAENATADATYEIKVAENILAEINKLDTSAAGYQTVINTLETAISDLGLKTSQFVDSAGKPIAKVSTKIPISQKMELKRRLGQIINYDVLDWEIKQELKPLVNALRDGIKTDLKAHSAEAASIWQNAEAEFEKAAKKFRNPNIRKIRAENLPERIATSIESPTILQEVKAAIPKDVSKQVEREIIEKIRKANPEQAQKLAREMSKSLSSEGKELVDKIIDAKVKPRSVLRTEKLTTSMLEDLAWAYETGSRPSKILDLWKTAKGQDLVNKALEGNPNKQEIIKYLNKQSLNDVVSTILNNDGIVDFTKVNRLLRDEATVKMLERVGGKDAVQFFKQLEYLSRKFEKNVTLAPKIHESAVIDKKAIQRGEDLITSTRKKQTSNVQKIERFLKDLGVTTPFKLKYLLSGLGVSAMFAPKMAATAFTTTVLIKLMQKPAVRRAFKEASSKGISNRALAQSINIILKAAEEDEKE